MGGELFWKVKGEGTPLPVGETRRQQGVQWDSGKSELSCLLFLGERQGAYGRVGDSGVFLGTDI